MSKKRVAFPLGVSWTVAKGRLDGDDKSEGKLTEAENHATARV